MLFLTSSQLRIWTEVVASRIFIPNNSNSCSFSHSFSAQEICKKERKARSYLLSCHKETIISYPLWMQKGVVSVTASSTLSCQTLPERQELHRHLQKQDKTKQVFFPRLSPFPLKLYYCVQKQKASREMWISDVGDGKINSREKLILSQCNVTLV